MNTLGRRKVWFRMCCMGSLTIRVREDKKIAFTSCGFKYYIKEMV
jgi:hypothetical protein